MESVWVDGVPVSVRVSVGEGDGVKDPVESVSVPDGVSVMLLAVRVDETVTLSVGLLV